MSFPWVAALLLVSLYHGFPSAGSQVANLQQETQFPLSVVVKGSCVSLFFPQVADVRGKVHILNVCILARPEHKFDLAEETGKKSDFILFLHF